MPQFVDYSTKNKVLSGKVNFKYYVQRRELVNKGDAINLNASDKDGTYFSFTELKDGSVDTTVDEKNSYINEITPNNALFPVLPSPPTALSATAGDGSVEIAFTPGYNGGSAITNYNYSINDGVTFFAFNPAQTTSPLTISGLTNGRTYSVKLIAVNIVGQSAPSASVSVTPFTNSFSPTALSGTPGNTTAIISFTQASNGGSPITNYQYSTDGGATFTAFGSPQTSSPVTISGLTNGVTYDIKLKAVNALAVSAASASVSVTPATSPSPPTALSGTPGDGSVDIAFTPGNNGGSAITNYRYSINNGVTFLAFSPAQTTSPVTISGLTNGVTYDIKLQAVNAVGTSVASAGVSVTPATSPSPPTGLSAAPANTAAEISFIPGDDGGSAITNYQYSINNGATFTAFSPAQTSSPVTISGLTNGTSYTIKLKAVNEIGVSAESTSVSIVPNNVTLQYSYFTTTGSQTWTAPATVYSQISYWVIGGGGGGGGAYDNAGSGGGGGGQVVSGSYSVTPNTSYTVVVGAGGDGGYGQTGVGDISGTKGIPSIFDQANSGPQALGGGGGYRSRESNTGGGKSGGAAVVPGPPAQASVGGSGGGDGGAGGGGGGSSRAGGNGTGASPAGSGGAGIRITFPGINSGNSVTYGVGGAGGIPLAGSGNYTVGEAGAVNTGNGGGGGNASSSAPSGQHVNGGQGGSGLVVIKYYA